MQGIGSSRGILSDGALKPVTSTQNRCVISLGEDKEKRQGGDGGGCAYCQDVLFRFGDQEQPRCRCLRGTWADFSVLPPSETPISLQLASVPGRFPTALSVSTFFCCLSCSVSQGGPCWLSHPGIGAVLPVPLPQLFLPWVCLQGVFLCPGCRRLQQGMRNNKGRFSSFALVFFLTESKVLPHVCINL